MVSHHPAKCSGHRHCGCGSGDIIVLLCKMILQKHLVKELCDFLGGSPMVNHRPAKFGDHGHCDSGDIMVLVCHVILQGHVIKASCEPLVVCHHLAKFCCHRHYGSGDIFLMVDEQNSLCSR